MIGLPGLPRNHPDTIKYQPLFAKTRKNEILTPDIGLTMHKPINSNLYFAANHHDRSGKSLGHTRNSSSTKKLPNVTLFERQPDIQTLASLKKKIIAPSLMKKNSVLIENY